VLLIITSNYISVLIASINLQDQSEFNQLIDEMGDEIMGFVKISLSSELSFAFNEMYEAKVNE